MANDLLQAPTPVANIPALSALPSWVTTLLGFFSALGTVGLPIMVSMQVHWAIIIVTAFLAGGAAQVIAYSHPGTPAGTLPPS